jgi:hypothetical protein
MQNWRRHRSAKRAWLFGGVAMNGNGRQRLEEAMRRGDVMPKSPSQVVATPPRLIGKSPLEVRRELIRQRVMAKVKAAGAWPTSLLAASSTKVIKGA